MALKIVGAGLGRTGTASLKVALEKLGVGRCYHMSEALANPEHMDLWLNAANGNPDWDGLLGEYGASVDYPACTYWQELADYYPDAKVLLTVRDAGRWFESVNETIMSPEFNEHIKGSPFGDLLEAVVWKTLDYRMQDRDFMVQYFERRTAEIKAVIPAGRLLVYEVKQGWQPLCEFLDLQVPDEPFPRINSRDETKQLLATLMSSGPDGPGEEQMAEVAKELHGDVRGPAAN